MKVSLNWLKEFTDIPDSPEELVKQIGSQLGAVEGVIDLADKYKGIVIAKVMTCVQHPNADKLHVCTIDVGEAAPEVDRDEQGYIQVVCGAPNVAAGQLVVWLPPGTVVPISFEHEPLRLEVRDIRGQKSNGMLASLHELAISDNHDSIAVIDPSEAKAGDNFMSTYKLDDTIIDIENKMLTHRPDLFGHIGIAREIAGIGQRNFRSPDWYLHPSDDTLQLDGNSLSLRVDNQLPDLAPRFMAVAVEVNATNGPSPLWLQSYLSRVGIRPINLLVDISNYMMLVTAQPLHFYDYDKLVADDNQDGQVCLIVRHPKEGESLTLLGGKVITPRKEAIMITSGDNLIGLAGIMGGEAAEVDANTKRIIVECATFDMFSIRRTVMEHGLFTDAATRYTKGQSPLQDPTVITQTVAMLRQFAAARVVSQLFDQGDYQQKTAGQSVYPSQVVKLQFINSRLGLQLSRDEVRDLLLHVEFSINDESEDSLKITAPFWRTDIAIAEDIVEEVGRLYGYDKLTLQLPKRDVSPVVADHLLATKARIRHILRQAGANEVLTYSFVHGDLLRKVGQDEKNAFELTNALSPGLQYYRLSLLPNLLEKVHPNLKAGYDEFALFEINQTHAKDIISKSTSLPIEEYRLGFVFAAELKTAAANYGGAPFYQAKKYLLELLIPFGITPIFETVNSSPDREVGMAALAPFAKQRTCYVKTINGTLLGELGEFSNAVRSNLKLPNFVAGFELDVKQIMHEQQLIGIDYQPLSRFPKVTQDVCLRVSAEMSYQSLHDFIATQLIDQKLAELHYLIEPADIYQRDDDKEHKQITFHISVVSSIRTLTDTEINVLLDKVVLAAHDQMGAERI